MLKSLSKRKTDSKNIMILIIMLMGILMFTSCGTSQFPVKNETLTVNPTPEASTSTTKEDTSVQPETPEPDDSISEAKEFSASEDMQLGNLKVDMQKSEIDKFITAEISETTVNTEFDMETEVVSYDDGTIIQLIGGKIYSISVTTADYPTPRGLKVGDKSDILKQLYGEPTAVEEDDRWIYSSRGYDLFFVTVKDGVVVKIMVSQVM
jgi:hypothetical protein